MISITADHEGGCLDRAVKCGEGFYSLVLRPDTWYYFNFKITGCKNKNVYFQFTAFNAQPMYIHGQYRWRYGQFIEKPVVSYDNGKTWEEVEVMRFEEEVGHFFFSHTFREDEAIVGFAPTYLHSDLQKYLKKIESNPYVTLSNVGVTHSGREVPRVTITRNKDSKKVFVLIGREDADETTGSVATEAAIDWLLSDDERAVRFLEKYRFECIPMVGIDGVICGATHSAGYGYGGHTYHLNPSPLEVENVKNFVRSLHKNGDEIVFAGKLHGGMRYTDKHAIDYLTASPLLDHYIRENPYGAWQPTLHDWSLTIRPYGYFERFTVDEFLVTEVFGCHINGTTKEICYECGKDLMITLANYLEKYNA